MHTADGGNQTASPPTQSFKVLDACRWALQTMGKYFRVWAMATLLIFGVTGVAAKMSLVASLFVHATAAYVLCCVSIFVAVHQSANPQRAFSNLQSIAFVRTLATVMVYSTIVACYVGFWGTVSAFTLIVVSKAESAVSMILWALGSLVVPPLVLLCINVWCVFVPYYAADGRFSFADSIGKGFSAGRRNWFKTSCALLLVTVIAASGMSIPALVNNEVFRYVYAIMFIPPYITFVSLVFAHSYRQVSGGPVPAAAPNTPPTSEEGPNDHA